MSKITFKQGHSQLDVRRTSGLQGSSKLFRGPKSRKYAALIVALQVLSFFLSLSVIRTLRPTSSALFLCKHFLNILFNFYPPFATIYWPYFSVRSIMQKYLEKTGEIKFEKIFNQKLGFLLLKDFAENIAENACPQIKFYEAVRFTQTFQGNGV